MAGEECQMDPSALHDPKIQSILERMAQAGIANAASGLSQMIGRNITMSVPRVTVLPISAVPERVGGAEAPVVGIYLAAEGEITGHIMLIMDRLDAVQLLEMLLGPIDEGNDFDSLARSALAEVGNIVASFFLNGVATLLGRSGRPSPPAVIVDMAGAILDVMLIAAGQLGDEVLLFETVFQSEERELSMFFWMLPDLLPLRLLV
jgi:chemotaxis protein CheC